MLYVTLAVATLIAATMAVRATRLLTAALWLAGVSALTAIMLYLVGAYLMAAIELSLSVGLITILLVFAISMVGADSPDQPVSRLMNWPLIITMLLLVIGLTLPLLSSQTSAPESSFSTIFWQLRQQDVLAQIALIFTGVLGVLGLLAESHKSRTGSEQPEARAESECDEVVEPIAQPDYKHEPELEKV